MSDVEGAEQAEQSEPAPSKRGGRTPIVIAVLGLVTALGSGVLAWLALEQARENRDRLEESDRAASQLASRLGALEGDLNVIESRVSDSESDIQRVRSELGSIDDPTDNLFDLGSRIDAIESDLADTSSDLEDFSFAVIDSIVELRTCLNDYMDTVGRSGGGRYTYYYC